MTEPDPVEYPAEWKPSYIRERDDAVEPLAVERHLAAMDEQELTLLLQRVRGMR